MPENLILKIRMRHVVNGGMVQFLRGDKDGNALAQFESELQRIVAEAVAEEMERLRSTMIDADRYAGICDMLLRSDRENERLRAALKVMADAGVTIASEALGETGRTMT